MTNILLHLFAFFNTFAVVWGRAFQFWIIYIWWIELQEKNQNKNNILSLSLHCIKMGKWLLLIFLFFLFFLPCTVCYGIFPMALDCPIGSMLHQDFEWPNATKYHQQDRHQFQWWQRVESTAMEMIKFDITVLAGNKKSQIIYASCKYRKFVHFDQFFY